MRILHITNSYFDTSVYVNLQKGQEYHDASTAVISPCLYSKKLPENIPTNVLPLPSYSNWQRFFFVLKENNILRKFYKHDFPVEDYDIIHAHTVFSNGYIAWKLAKKFNKPFFLTVRDTDVNVFFKYRWNLRKLGVRLLNDAAGIIFLSESYRNTLVKKYVPKKFRANFLAKSIVIPNGIYDSYFDNASEHSPLADAGSCRILSVGEITARKNFPAVCKAVEILRQKGIGISLQIIGKPTNPVELKKIQSYNFVNYHPPVPKEELVHYFRNNDIFVLASHTETFGLVYAEAMTQGMPVLYTSGQGFDLQFPEGAVGYSVNDRSPEDIAEKIQLVMANYSELSKNSSRLVEKFKCTNTGRMHMEFYHQQLVSSK